MKEKIKIRIMRLLFVFLFLVCFVSCSDDNSDGKVRPSIEAPYVGKTNEMHFESPIECYECNLRSDNEKKLFIKIVDDGKAELFVATSENSNSTDCIYSVNYAFFSENNMFALSNIPRDLCIYENSGYNAFSGDEELFINSNKNILLKKGD